MIKKAIATAAAVGISAVALLGTDACSYSQTWFGNVREAVRAEIDPEFELDHIRDRVSSLMPEIHQHMKIVAEQIVEVRDMQVTIAEKHSSLSGQKAAILTLRSDLDSGNEEFVYRQVSYTRPEVESDLAQRFHAYQLLETSLEGDIKILTATQETLKANQKNLDAMMSRKQGLVVKVSQAEARLKQIQATETVNAIEVDDTQLSHVEELLQQLNHDLDVRQALLETEGHTLGRIQVSETEIPARNVIGEIDAHFGLFADGSQKTKLAAVKGL